MDLTQFTRVKAENATELDCKPDTDPCMSQVFHICQIALQKKGENFKVRENFLTNVT